MSGVQILEHLQAQNSKKSRRARPWDTSTRYLVKVARSCSYTLRTQRWKALKYHLGLSFKSR